MKPTSWRVLGALTLAAMAVVVVISVVGGGCEKLIECTSGAVPMKCHWTFQATWLVGILGMASSGASIAARTKEGRRIAALMTLLICVAIALVPTSLVIGLCDGSAMQCHQTAHVVWAAAAIGAIAAVVQLAKADPEKADLPKMKL